MTSPPAGVILIAFAGRSTSARDRPSDHPLIELAAERCLFTYPGDNVGRR